MGPFNIGTFPNPTERFKFLDAWASFIEQNWWSPPTPAKRKILKRAIIIGNFESWDFGIFGILDLGVWDLGDLGSWEFGILGIGDLDNLGSWILRIWDLEDLGSWGFGILRIWYLRDLGSWEFGIWDFGSSWSLESLLDWPTDLNVSIYEYNLHYRLCCTRHLGPNWPFPLAPMESIEGHFGPTLWALCPHPPHWVMSNNLLLS